MSIAEGVSESGDARATVQPMISVTGLGVALGGRDVLTGVDLAVDAGSWVGIVGPNGAGKSTLLRTLAGLQAADAGTVQIAGTQLCRLRPRDRGRLVAYAPQIPVIPEEVTVWQWAMLGRTPHLGYFAWEGDVDRAVVGEAIERLDLAGLASRRVASLSGGERQRAVLAQVLAQQASVLLLDEPTAALDIGHAQQVLELVDVLRRESGLTVVSTLHDLTLAGQYVDRLHLLSAGRVVASGDPASVLTPVSIEAQYGAAVEVHLDRRGRPIVHPVRR